MNAHFSPQSSAPCHKGPSSTLTPLLCAQGPIEDRTMLEISDRLENSTVARQRKRIMMLIALSLVFATAVPVMVLAGH